MREAEGNSGEPQFLDGTLEGKRRNYSLEFKAEAALEERAIAVLSRK